MVARFHSDSLDVTIACCVDVFIGLRLRSPDLPTARGLHWLQLPRLLVVWNFSLSTGSDSRTYFTVRRHSG